MIFCRKGSGARLGANQQHRLQERGVVEAGKRINAARDEWSLDSRVKLSLSGPIGE